MSLPMTDMSSPTSQLSADFSTDAFSEVSKLEVQRLANDKCWACATPMTQACYVFGRSDPQFNLWSSHNLIDFEISSKDNGIALCPLCHGYFDQIADPGFVFLPTDLQYFIDYELNDREQRLKGNRCRKVPTAEEYKLHHYKKGQVLAESIGGLYRPIFLQNYLVGGQLTPEQLSGLTAPKTWHGAPIGAIRRGILVLGGGRVSSLDEKTVSQLETLRNLYFQDSGSSRQPASVEKEGDKRPAEDVLGGSSKKAKPQGPEGAPKNRGGFEDPESSTRFPGAVDFNREWVLGPDFTAAQAVRRYAPMLSYKERGLHSLQAPLH